MSKISKDKQSDSVGREESRSLLDEVKTADDIRRLLRDIPKTTLMKEALDRIERIANTPVKGSRIILSGLRPRRPPK